MLLPGTENASILQAGVCRTANRETLKKWLHFKSMLYVFQSSLRMSKATFVGMENIITVKKRVDSHILGFLPTITLWWTTWRATLFASLKAHHQYPLIFLQESVEVAPVAMCLVSESPVILLSVRAGGAAHTPDSLQLSHKFWWCLQPWCDKLYTAILRLHFELLVEMKVI